MADHVDDPRHRYSYELRPDAALDRSIRELALRLELDGLIASGAATAPRFQPHITLLRADHADESAVRQLALDMSARPGLELAEVGTFGHGRILWIAPADDRALRTARSRLVAALGDEHVDPLALARDPWVPHVTVAYAIDEPNRAAAKQLLGEHVPLRGHWTVAQCWDLDVRPTTCVANASIRHGH
ncbi:MAG: 2'-5' RNA ligase family protein [Thermoleophilia bacterium]|nr:2'-5' RNA ligase family protein [Thermoleophilia bacterium]